MGHVHLSHLGQGWVLHLTPCTATPFKVVAPVTCDKAREHSLPVTYLLSALREKWGTMHMVRPLRNPLLVCTEVGETPIQQLLISLNLITGATRPGEGADKNQCPDALIPGDWHLRLCVFNNSSSYYSERGPLMSLPDFREHSTNPNQVACGLRVAFTNP